MKRLSRRDLLRNCLSAGLVALVGGPFAKRVVASGEPHRLPSPKRNTERFGAWTGKASGSSEASRTEAQPREPHDFCHLRIPPRGREFAMRPRTARVAFRDRGACTVTRRSVRISEDRQTATN